MSLDFYDHSGKPYAYCDDGETLFSFSGRPIGYFDGDSVYSFLGRHLGYFENGQLWDHSGSVVLFTDESSSGPLKPLKALKPLKGLKQLRPLKGLKQLRPMRALKSSAWSNSPPDVFFA